jgi:hypothetical protein
MTNTIIRERLVIEDDGVLELPPIDLSRFHQLTVEVRLTGNAGDDGTDLLDIYFQARSHHEAPWIDRVHVHQVTGSDEAGWYRQYTIRNLHQPLSVDEEAGEPPGDDMTARS